MSGLIIYYELQPKVLDFVVNVTVIFHFQIILQYNEAKQAKCTP